MDGKPGVIEQGCPTCGVPWSEHEGLARLCARLQDETRRRLALQTLVLELRERIAGQSKA